MQLKRFVQGVSGEGEERELQAYEIQGDCFGVGK